MSNPSGEFPTSPISIVIEITNRILLTLFGELGIQEFRIEGFTHDTDSELWEINIVREINGLSLNYQLEIDDHSGEILGFRRI